MIFGAVFNDSGNAQHTTTLACLAGSHYVILMRIITYYCITEGKFKLDFKAALWYSSCFCGIRPVFAVKQILSPDYLHELACFEALEKNPHALQLITEWVTT